MSGEEQGRRGAEWFRERHHLGQQPLADLITTVEQACDADVAILADGDDAHGLTVRHAGTTIIGVARCRHPMRQRSTIAHELAHVHFDDLRRAGSDRRWDTRDPEEIRADAFARHLLLPVAAVKTRSHGRIVDEQMLSDLVQSFGASPAIVAIQMREAGLIDHDLCRGWSAMTTAGLATRFGWAAQYKAMTVDADTLRPPQRLLTRATRAYAEGVVSVATVARLNNSRDVAATQKELTEAGVTPRRVTDAPPARPTTGSLSPADLDELLRGIDD